MGLSPAPYSKILEGITRSNAGIVLSLSDLSSDETSPEALSARLAFDVSDETLTLTVFNDTPDVGGYDITAVYFNATPDISDLLYATGAPGWSLLLNEHADGFGMYDFGLLSELRNDPGEIAPQGRGRGIHLFLEFAKGNKAVVLLEKGQNGFLAFR